MRTTRFREQSPGALSTGSGDEREQRRERSAGPGGRFRNSRQSRDPRPVGERAYAMQCARNVAEFLASRNFHKTVVPEKFLRDPSTREFYDIFKFLMAQIDPQLEISGPMEQEVPQIMKRLKYPVEVNRSKLQAISGPNTWPQLLAVLDWIINLIQVHNQFIQPLAACQLSLKSASLAGCDGSHHILHSMRESYMQYLRGRESSAEEESLRQIYQERIEALGVDVGRLEEQKNKVESYLTEFHSEHESLVDLQEAPGKLAEESEQVKEATKRAEAELQRLSEAFEESGCEQLELTQKAEELQEKVKQLTAEVEMQPHSKREIERLKSARDSLRRMLSDLKVDGEKAEQEVWNLQLKEQNASAAVGRLVRSIADQAAAVEQALQDAGVMGHRDLQLKVDPEDAPEALTLVDFDEALQKVRAAAAAQERLRHDEESAGQELVQEQKALQDETVEKERECQRLRARIEQLEKIRDENRMWSAEQLEDAQQAAEEAEDQVAQASMGSAGPSVRDVGEMDELRLLLNTLRTRGAEELEQLREKLERDRERDCQLKENIQNELEAYAEDMESLSKAVIDEVSKTGVAIASAVGGS